jgi:hypothetical protein
MITFAVLFAAAFAAHQLGDHVLGQTDAQARDKAAPGRAGWSALGRHLAGYHLVQAVMVGLTVAALGVPLSPAGAAVGLAVSVVTHGLWDRRRPVRWVLRNTGAPRFADLMGTGMNGMYLADQALHIGCLWAATLLAAVAS